MYKQQYKLAEDYELARGVEKDESQAFQLYSQLAIHGYAPAQYKLGKMYLDNLFCALYKQVFFKDSLLPGVIEQLKQSANIDDDIFAQFALDRVYECNIYNAKKLFELAVVQGNSDAQCALGEIYAKGNKWVAKDLDNAIELYQKAIEQGNIAAKFKLSEVYIVKNNIEQAVVLCKEAASAGYAPAQYSLAIRCDTGDGVEKDAGLAAELCKKAAYGWYAPAQYDFAVRCDTGNGINKDENMATYFYLKAAEQGYAKAQNTMGLKYANGQNVNKDCVKAIDWYRKAAAQDDPDAQFNLAEIYNSGYDQVVPDVQKAAKLYRKAANQDHANAQFNVGVMYSSLAALITINDDYNPNNENEILKDYQKSAAKWYLKAAIQNHPDAQYNLALMYMAGTVVTKSNQIAAKWYERAASQGHAVSQYNLGVMYSSGDGIVKDEFKATECFQNAAENGVGAAMFNLGIRYDSGLGVKEIDQKLAFTYYLQAAEKGVPSAQYNVSIMYDDGVGVEKNSAMASKWFNEANKNGYVDQLKVALQQRTENQLSTTANKIKLKVSC